MLDEAEFTDAVNQLLAAREAGHASLLVAPGGVTIAFHPNTERTVSRQVKDEVEDAIWAAISRSTPEAFANRRDSPAARLMGIEPEREDLALAERKLNLIRERLPMDELQRRRWLKVTSKTHVPATIEWDVASKSREDTIPLPSGGPVPFGLLRVAAGPPGHSLQNPEDSMLLTLDKEDVTYFIAIMEALREALEEANDG